MDFLSLLSTVPTRISLLVHPDAALQAAIAHVMDLQPEARAKSYGQNNGGALYRIDNGVAIIPVTGSLSPRGATGYGMVRSELRHAAANPEVKEIVMLMDSPGGTVSGIDMMASDIRAAREQKKVTAMVEGMAASAAYWMASQASEIVMTPMSEVGSIGVVTMHMDVSNFLSNIGVKPTLIYSGAHKVDGNPFEPLPDAVRSETQAEVDGLRLEFARAVSDGRPKLASDVAMATDARMYSAKQAIDLGLADRIGSLDDVVMAAGSTNSRYRAITKPENVSMENENQNTPAPAAPAAKSNAVADDRARIALILGSEEAKGREALAQQLALETDLSPEAAVNLLKAAPVASAPAPAPVQQAAVPPISQRAAFVPTPGAADTKPSFDANAAWSDAVKRQNARMVGNHLN